MRDKEQKETSEEKDMGMAVTANLRPSVQCTKAARTAQTILDQAFHYHDQHVFAHLQKQYVRPHLELSTSAWSPWMVQNGDCME
jgi:hypothetical protein